MREPVETVATTDPDCKLRWQQVNAGEIQTVCGRYAIASVGNVHVIALLEQRRGFVYAGQLATAKEVCELHRQGAQAPAPAPAARQLLLGRAAGA